MTLCEERLGANVVLGKILPQTWLHQIVWIEGCLVKIEQLLDSSVSTGQIGRSFNLIVLVNDVVSATPIQPVQLAIVKLNILVSLRITKLLLKLRKDVPRISMDRLETKKVEIQKHATIRDGVHFRTQVKKSVASLGHFNILVQVFGLDGLLQNL